MPIAVPTRQLELQTFRVLCLLGSAGLPALGYVFAVADPGFVDPWWLRLSIAALPLALFTGSFVSEAVRREIGGLANVLLYVLIAWFVALAYYNDLSAEYALGGILLLIGVGVVGSAGHSRPWMLGAAMSVAILALLLVGITIQSPGVDWVVYSVAVLIGGGILFVGALLQIRLRDQLFASELRYRTVFEQVADGVLLVRAEDLTVVASNQAFRGITGYSRQELSGKSLYDLTSARRDEVDRDVQKALESGSVDIGERRYRRRDGAYCAVKIGFARITEAHQTLVCITVRDLSEETKARTQIEIARDQAEAMLELRSNFLDNMSHELRTPLVALTGFLDLLEEEDSDLHPYERREILGSLRRSTDRLGQTLNALLDLAQIESGRLELHPEPVEMNAAVGEAVDLLQGMAHQKGLALRFEPGEPARVIIDPPSLRRILLNLFSNAIKFTGSGGITVSLEADSHRIFLHVRDTGVGIDPAFLPHLFGAFQQASGGQNREHEGSGLGLTITKRLLDLNGGRIRVDSAPGEGTCISIVFARTWATSIGEQEPSVRLDAAEPVSHRGDGGGVAHKVLLAPVAARPRALIVEDNDDTARLMNRMLMDHFDVDVAPEARTALRLARDAWYDVLLVDIHLGPGMDGVQLLKRLRQMSAYTHVPAVAVTTYTATGDRERFLAAGFDAYMPKPFTRRQLIAAAEHAHANRARTTS